MDRASSAPPTAGTTGTTFSSQSSTAETLGDIAAMRAAEASKDTGRDDNISDSNNYNNDGDEDDEFDATHIHQAAMFRGQKLKNKIKIKIVVAEVAHTQIRRSFRRLVSPVLSMFDLLPEFGMFHSGEFICAFCGPRITLANVLTFTTLSSSLSLSPLFSPSLVAFYNSAHDWTMVGSRH